LRRIRIAHPFVPPRRSTARAAGRIIKADFERIAMTAVLHHIKSLESYVERSGARVVRARLPASVHGGAAKNLITLQMNLDPEQQLRTLVHEMTHWLTHQDAPHLARCTIYEYEAEAVEALVMARLGLPGTTQSELIGERPTDGLLSSSVSRVLSAAGRIYQALGLEP
jgi:hypothetical protein